MIWINLPLSIQQDSEQPERLRISCKFCEMTWTGFVEIRDAVNHIEEFHWPQFGEH